MIRQCLELIKSIWQKYNIEKKMFIFSFILLILITVNLINIIGNKI